MVLWALVLSLWGPLTGPTQGSTPELRAPSGRALALPPTGSPRQDWLALAGSGWLALRLSAGFRLDLA